MLGFQFAAARDRGNVAAVNCNCLYLLVFQFAAIAAPYGGKPAGRLRRAAALPVARVDAAGNVGMLRKEMNGMTISALTFKK